jgi:membrane protease YdiL (CAAX protease family)
MSRFRDNAGRLRPLWAFAVSLFLSGLAFFVSNNIAHEAGDQRPFRTELIFRSLWSLLLFGIFAWMLTIGDHVEEHRIAAQGLPRVRGWLKHFILGCLVGGFLTGLAVVPIDFLGRFRFIPLWSVHLLPNLGAVLLMLLAGALAEELLFRGYPFQHLAHGIGAAPAVIVMSALYGVLHLLNPHAGLWGAGNSFLMGVLLCVAYLRTQALWLPWGIHFGWNTAMGFLFGLPVSGYRVFNLWLYTDAFGPKWLTGGQYGIEAGAAGTVVFLIGILLLWKLPLRVLPQPARTLAPETPLRDTVPSIQH